MQNDKKAELGFGPKLSKTWAPLEFGLKPSSQGLCPAKGQGLGIPCPVLASFSPGCWECYTLECSVCQGQEESMSEWGKRLLQDLT